MLHKKALASDDKLNSELIVENQRIELISKKADLLILLYDAVNTSIEREVILKESGR